MKSTHKCVFSATTGRQKILGILCYTKLATDSYSLLVETYNRQFVYQSLCIILYSQELVSADNLTQADDFITQTVVKLLRIFKLYSHPRDMDNLNPEFARYGSRNK